MKVQITSNRCDTQLYSFCKNFKTKTINLYNDDNLYKFIQYRQRKLYKDKGRKFAVLDYKFLDQVIIRRDINQLSLITRLQRRFDYKFGKENLCLIT